MFSSAKDIPAIFPPSKEPIKYVRINEAPHRNPINVFEKI